MGKSLFQNKLESSAQAVVQRRLKFIIKSLNFDLDYIDFLQKQDTHHRAKHMLAQELEKLEEEQDTEESQAQLLPPVGGEDSCEETSYIQTMKWLQFHTTSKFCTECLCPLLIHRREILRTTVLSHSSLLTVRATL